MKKLIAFVIILVFVLSLSACNKNQPNSSDTSPNSANSEKSVVESDFSYAEEKGIYTEDVPGVKYDGFSNTSEIFVSTGEDAIERAKNECTIEWDTTQVYFDSEAGIWKVVFYTSGMVGGDQSVYLGVNGKTVLVIYGE